MPVTTTDAALETVPIETPWGIYKLMGEDGVVYWSIEDDEGHILAEHPDLRHALLLARASAVLEGGRP